MEILLLIEIILLVIFIFLGIKIIGKIIGLIIAIIAWLIVGSLLFSFFLYPDYKNFKDPTIVVKCGSNKNLRLFENYGNFKITNDGVVIKEGTSIGKIYIDCNYALENIDKVQNFEDRKEIIKFLVEGYKKRKVIFNPKLKNEELFNLTLKFI